MSESTTVDVNILVLAWGYTWKVLTIIMLPIIWLFINRVRKDFDIVHLRIDKGEKEYITVKEIALKDELAAEIQDRTISAIEALEITTKELAREIRVGAK